MPRHVGVPPACHLTVFTPPGLDRCRWRNQLTM